jgi:H+-translocating NAD(P) transhydrogenase
MLDSRFLPLLICTQIYVCRMLDMFKRPGDLPEHNYLYIIPALALLGIYSFGYYLQVPAIASMTYLASAVACIAAIGCLAQQKTARTGNALGLIGVTGGLAATAGILAPTKAVAGQLLGCLGIGMVVGAGIAQQLKITELPEMVAAFHSLV